MNDSAHSLPDDDRIAPDPRGSGDTPDWRVSADQGADAERTAVRPPERVRDHLRLATSNDLSSSVPMERPVAPTGGAKPAQEKRSVGPKAWTAAASSVPKLKVDTSPPAASEDAGRGAARVRAAAEEAAELDADEAAIDEADGFLGDGIPGKNPMVAPVQKLEEPFWVVWLDELRSNSKLQMGIIAAIVVGIVIYAVWPKGDPGVSLHDLKKNAQRWDNASVTVKGRVGEVFHVGAGWAFNLHQGRDTIVVFTRTAPPRLREKVAVSGSVSTGYLDGQPRQAIFASEMKK